MMIDLMLYVVDCFVQMVWSSWRVVSDLVSLDSVVPRKEKQLILFQACERVKEKERRGDRDLL